MKIFAHRGASAAAPENTMWAFEKALEMGAHGFEFDVRLTADQTVVVIHDATIDRTSNGSGFVSDMTYAKLMNYDFSGTYTNKGYVQRIPRLIEVLDMAKGTNAILNIEMKADRKTNAMLTKKLAQMLNECDYDGRIVVSSFDHESLVHLKQMSPKTAIAPLYSCVLHEPFAYAVTMGATGLHPRFGAIDREIIRKSRQKGIFVHVWTVNDIDDMRTCANDGVNGIITDVPDRALAEFGP